MTNYIVILLSLIFLSFPSLAADFMVLEGKLTDSTGLVPIEEADVDFVIEIYSPGAEQCLLYKESFDDVNMSNSKGFFSLKLGQGARSGGNYEDTSSFSTALSNGVGTVTPTSCAAGPNYTPGANDSRRIRISYNDNINGFQTLQQDIEVGASAYAMSAGSLNGVGAADILQVNMTGTNVLNQANLENIFDGANHTELLALLDGTSTQYMTGTPASDFSVNSNKITNVAAPTAATDAANKNYVDTKLGGSTIDTSTVSGVAGDNFVVTWNQASQEWEAVAVNDSTKLPLAGGTMSGALNMGSQDILATGHITMGATKALTLGKYNSTEETALTSGLSAANAGATWYNSTLNQIVYWDGSGSVPIPTAAGSGETNTASNVGNAGIGVFDAKNTSDLEFRNINSTSGALTVTLDAANKNIDLTLVESSFNENMIPVTATGDVSATNLQAAIVELDSEKMSNAGDTMTGALNLDAQNEIRFSDSDNSHYVGFRAPANISAGASFVWDLPDDDGTAGQVLQTNGSGVLSWMTPAAGGDFMADGSVPMTAALKATGGSAASPGITFVGDLDTGIYKGAPDQLDFVTGANSRLVINSTGNVGVNQLTPASRFHVNGDIQVGNDGAGCSSPKAGAIRFNAGIIEYCNGTAWINLSTDGVLMSGNTGSIVDMGTTDAFDVRIKRNGIERLAVGATNLSFKDNTGTEKMMIDSGGAHVSGILSAAGPVQANGFTSNSVDTDVALSSEKDVILHSDTNTPTGGDIRFETGASPIERMRIKNSGEIGIGTSNPEFSFQVHRSPGVIGPNTTIAAVGQGSGAGRFLARTSTTTPAGNDKLLEMSGEGWNGSFYEPGAHIRMFATDGSWSSNKNTAIEFSTAFSGSSPQPRLLIAPDGNLGIGTTTPGALLHVEGNSQFVGPMSVIGPVTASSVVLGSGGITAGTPCTGAQDRELKFDSIGDLLVCRSSGSGNWEYLVEVLPPLPHVEVTTAFDFYNGPIQYTDQNCGNFALQHIEEGQRYQLFVKGTGAGNCTFSFTDGGGSAISAGNVRGLTSGTTFNNANSDMLMFEFILVGGDLFVNTETF